ncbi:MAG: fibronectin type III domain-containing protein [Archangiaceae bacterium]|nr:fibronectin type III domain-containing protein [Archangiaceae bacterium]
MIESAKNVKDWRIARVALLLLVFTACEPGDISSQQMESELLDTDVAAFSLSADRSNPLPLAGATVKGAIYVFHSARNGARSVRFFIDDPAQARAPFSVERSAPFDLAGSSSTGAANAYDTRLLSDGAHQLTVERTNNRGTVRAWTISFNVSQPGTTMGAPLIEERFDAAATNFDTTGGTWKVVGGQYVLSAPTAAPIPTFGLSNYALHQTARTGDFTVQVDARTTDTDWWADFAVIFSFRDASNYWYAAFASTDDAFTNGLFKVENGVQTEVASFGSTVAPSTAYAISITQASGALTVRSNGAALATVTANPGDGRFGLGSRDNAAVFDDLVAWGTALSADTQLPSVAFSAPAAGATVSGASALSGTAADNAGLSKVELAVDSGAYVPATGTTSWSFALDTTSLSNGSHTLTARATDLAGNTATATRVVTVSNVSAGDATPPSTPTGLTATAVSSTQVNLTWAASADNVGVTGYRVYRGGASLATVSALQYSATGLTASTLYSFTVVALDAAGNASPASAAASATTQAVPTGGFPDESNTGPSGTLTATSGNVWISTPNTIIENRKHTGTLQVAATGVIIRNVHLIGNITVEPGASLTVLDTLVDNGTNFSSGGISGASNITVRRTEIIGGGHSFSCKSNCDIQDSYFHGQANPPSSMDVHGDGILFNQATNMIVKHNTLACDMPADGGGACSAGLAMYGDWGPVSNVLVQNNLFKASPAGYCMSPAECGASRPGRRQGRSKKPRPSKIAGLAFSMRATRVADCLAAPKW